MQVQHHVEAPSISFPGHPRPPLSSSDRDILEWPQCLRFFFLGVHCGLSRCLRSSFRFLFFFFSVGIGRFLPAKAKPSWLGHWPWCRANGRDAVPHSGGVPVLFASRVSVSSVCASPAASGCSPKGSLLTPEPLAGVVGVASSIRALIMSFKGPKGIYIHTREPHLASKFSSLEYSQELGRNKTYLRRQNSFL